MPLLRRRSKTEDAAGDGKGGKAKDGTASGRVTPKGTGRYTPPTPKEYKVSPRWVPVLMLVFLLAGMLVIISNYMPGAGLLPGDTDNKWLLIGLGLITAGFITATKYR
ncbi:MAG TPA: cell division protein CrgA [Acidimicrobiales bacterium]|nr:cell division protein CrgA [Acidimicrobiales bacterium]